jgi:hypothetical protein
MELRFSYSPSIPFSLGTTSALACAWLITAAALVVFNFLTQAEQPLCLTALTPRYNPSSCPRASLTF